MSTPNVAILHNSFAAIGGGENVALKLGEIFNAPIFTTYSNLREPPSNIEIIELSHKLPYLNRFNQKLTFSNLNLDEYGDFDTVITLGEYAKYYMARQDQKHIHYVHSPIRTLYDLRTSQSKLANLFRYTAHTNELAQYSHIDTVIANSLNTQHRLLKYLNIKSQVIYPPLDVASFHAQDTTSENYYLSVQRLYPEKRVLSQVKAFNKLGKNLIIVGTGETKILRELRKVAKPNIDIRGYVNNYDLKYLYRHCTGLVSTSINEDFGYTPCEAMASGKPAICVNEGGYKETIQHNKTGILFEHGNLTGTIRQAEAIDWNPTSIRKHAMMNFDISIFRKKMEKLLK